MYTVILSYTAEKFLKGLSGRDYNLVSTAISSLSRDPYQPGTKKLKGYHGIFRIRAGNYRILYTVDGSNLIVKVDEIGHRKDIYD